MCLFTAHSSHAQSGEEESIGFSGSVDTYFRTNLRLIAELRLDQSSSAVFDSMTADQLSSFIVAAVYSF